MSKTGGSTKIHHIPNNKNDSRTQSAQSINRGDGIHDTTSDEEDGKKINNSKVKGLMQGETTPTPDMNDLDETNPSEDSDINEFQRTQKAMSTVLETGGEERVKKGFIH